MWNGGGRGWMTTGVARVQREAGIAVHQHLVIERQGCRVRQRYASPRAPDLVDRAAAPLGPRTRIPRSGTSTARFAHRTCSPRHLQRRSPALAPPDRAAAPSESRKRTSGLGSDTVRLAQANVRIGQQHRSNRAPELSIPATAPFGSRVARPCSRAHPLILSPGIRASDAPHRRLVPQRLR